ncbi:nitroreductase family protein [Fictibacillus terranigra]|uniref:Putative NAD(P)H nitroreductase n=1 Tax=Fictibacillus terranigra TaxID=3058424 RepID=A0ABT8E5G1_9BACL|nr:nitroreductase [Fictibacillus sp. CENA-BCM004]MDN4073143.1 nitroreductase [Fictibacillus sp. CENA-BCM004]
MDIFEAINTRRSIGLVKDDPVPEHLVEKILEAGTFAPNHYRTNPWRFFVISESGRNKLGELLAAITKSGMNEPLSEEDQQKLENVKKKPLRAPVIIAVGVEPGVLQKVIHKEETAAVSASIQNMLLAAHALGLGAVWRTGAICYDDRVRSYFQLSDKGEMAGFIYLGYPIKAPAAIKRKSFHEFTKWLK